MFGKSKSDASHDFPGQKQIIMFSVAIDSIGTHLTDSTGRHFIDLKLLLQQLWLTVAKWAS